MTANVRREYLRLYKAPFRSIHHARRGANCGFMAAVICADLGLNLVAAAIPVVVVAAAAVAVQWQLFVLLKLAQADTKCSLVGD